ncbi:MAG: hypothetical protein KGI91_11880 [Burkholderiales bacterium]|nr:hypothetical protein [Burkholderiales bacterium]MDE2077755.1 hypothetical protein [Burkholderiales bacterium]MDE2432356.1 hypothetical protein [Burkholderiales bacterium]HET8694094.1 hypothetical protein [Aquabacterium sp.]
MNSTKSKRMILVVSLVGATLLSRLLWLVAHIPSFDDAAIADRVGHEISQQYGHFPDRAEVEKEGHGQIYFAHPGAFRKPRVDLYEVTSPADMARVEAAAREAVQDAHARSVTLRFFEKENIKLFASGGQGHGPEHLLKQEVIQRG